MRLLKPSRAPPTRGAAGCFNRNAPVISWVPERQKLADRGKRLGMVERQKRHRRFGPNEMGYPG